MPSYSPTHHDFSNSFTSLVDELRTRTSCMNSLAEFVTQTVHLTHRSVVPTVMVPTSYIFLFQSHISVDPDPNCHLIRLQYWYIISTQRHSGSIRSCFYSYTQVVVGSSRCGFGERDSGRPLRPGMRGSRMLTSTNSVVSAFNGGASTSIFQSACERHWTRFAPELPALYPYIGRRRWSL